MKKNLLVCDADKRMKYGVLLSLVDEVMKEYDVASAEMLLESNDTNTYAKLLSNSEYDYIFTIDMAGFQVGTFLGTIAYNMVCAKQIHLVLDYSLMEKYGHNEMALNLYIFISDDKSNDSVKFEHIPNLHFYKPLEADSNERVVDSPNNRACVREIIGKVMKEMEESCCKTEWE